MNIGKNQNKIRATSVQRTERSSLVARNSLLLNVINNEIES